MSSSNLKDNLRKNIWKLLELKGVSRFPKPINDRIPNFEGSAIAGRKVLDLPVFGKSNVVKVNPDYPQMSIRKGVLDAGKILIMPTPRLRKGFFVLDPDKIEKKHHQRASTIRGSFKYGTLTALKKIPFVDLIVCGSVAVNKAGFRVGKGGGYSELEYVILKMTDKVISETPIITTVHDLQIVNKIEIEKHDFTVDIISTPTKLIRIKGPHQRPDKIIWSLLSKEKIDDMPILKDLRKGKQ